MTLAMASACVNSIGATPDQTYLDCPPNTFPPYGWLAPPSPRISFSRDTTDYKFPSPKKISGATTTGDFEFRLDDPVTMLPAADELFSDGKLVPLDVSAATVADVTSVGEDKDINGIESNGEERRKPPAADCTSSSSRLNNEAVVAVLPTNESDPYLFSPKAPRCSSRWRELLGLKRSSGGGSTKETAKSTSSSNLSSTPVAASTSSTNTNTGGSKSFRYFLQRNSKSPSSNLSSTSDASLNLPLLRDTDSEPLSISSRLSLSSISSSSSSSVSHDDLPRLSLDSLTTATKNRSNNTIHRHHHTCLYRSSSGPNNNNYPRVKMVKQRMIQTPSPATTTTTTTVDMPPLIDHPSAPTTTTIPVTNCRVGRSPIRLSGCEHDSSMMMRGLSVDSPRLSSSGKIVFQGLERSCSSPSTFNGGPRYKHSRPIDRSYSANVRVLNVPVGSFRGSFKSSGGGGGGGMFGFFSSSSSTSAQSSQVKKETGGGSGSSGGVKGQHHHYHQLVRW